MKGLRAYQRNANPRIELWEYVQKLKILEDMMAKVFCSVMATLGLLLIPVPSVAQVSPDDLFRVSLSHLRTNVEDLPPGDYAVIEFDRAFRRVASEVVPETSIEHSRVFARQQGLQLGQMDDIVRCREGRPDTCSMTGDLAGSFSFLLE
jgi:hypothetical protein